MRRLAASSSLRWVCTLRMGNIPAARVATSHVIVIHRKIKYMFARRCYVSSMLCISEAIGGKIVSS